MRSWQAVSAEFDALGVIRVGISPDTVEKAAGLKEKLGLTMPLLSDASLAVTDLYNLRYTDGKTPYVTTIFIDAGGIVRWIDITPNYRKRNEGAVVLDHVKAIMTAAAAQPQARADESPFAVVLLHPGSDRVAVIKTVRAITGLGLADAKALVDSAPQSIATDLPRAEAETHLARLHTAGATAEIR